MKLKAQIMDEAALKRALMRISHEIAERNKGVENLVLVGILRRGEPIARIIRENIQKIEDMTLPCGSIDIRFYRDDLTELTENPVVRKTELPFDVTNKDVVLVDEDDPLTLANLMDYDFKVSKTDEDDGSTYTEHHKLSEFATRQDGTSVASISRENQTRKMSVTATTAEGYNTTLLSRQVETLLADYQAPDGVTVSIGGESTNVADMMTQMVQMIALALLFVYLVMVAQFQNLIGPFIVIFTSPLAFTGGLLALSLTGTALSMVSMMGFLVLSGVVVNNGIVFVDYANQLWQGGLDKTTALVATGRTRMRPILMTALTTILAMCTMLFSNDAGSALGKDMALVIIGGLTYATLMTLFIVPVMYDVIFRRAPKVVDTGSDDLDDVPDDAAEYMEEMKRRQLPGSAADEV